MYCKLFASLYQGTLRGKTDEILVFTNLLAHCGKDGTVDKHFRAIAEETGLSQTRVKAALDTLESPDPESRSPEGGGARIVRMDEHRAWGWQVVNYAKYRAIKSEDDRAEQNRLAQARWRERNKNKQPSASVSEDKQDVITDNASKPKEREREKQMEGERVGGIEVGEWAEKIVNAYIKRDDPLGCVESVMQAISTGEKPEAILTAVQEISALCEAAPDGAANQFVPKAKTFFMERQWRSPESFKNRWKSKGGVIPKGDVNDWHDEKAKWEKRS